MLIWPSPRYGQRPSAEREVLTVSALLAPCVTASLQPNDYVYDLTLTYFEGLCAAIPIPNLANKRSDCKPLDVVLVVNRYGFPQDSSPATSAIAAHLTP